MIEKNIADRVPMYPGRVRLTQINADIYALERADEPIIEGTPLDKATLDSIIKSRLTGRYYTPTLTRELIAEKNGVTISPIPTGGWLQSSGESDSATNGNYLVKASTDADNAHKACEAFTSYGWQSAQGVSAGITLYCEQALKVSKMSFILGASAPSYLTQLDIIGSHDGEEWAALGTYTSFTFDTLFEYTLSSVGEYNHYGLLFTSSADNSISVKNWDYSLYDIKTYKNKYELGEGVPVKWSEGQKITIQIPVQANSFGTSENTLNDIGVDVVMLAQKHYELTYNGERFNAKEL